MAKPNAANSDGANPNGAMQSQPKHDRPDQPSGDFIASRHTLSGGRHFGQWATGVLLFSVMLGSTGSISTALALENLNSFNGSSSSRMASGSQPGRFTPESTRAVQVVLREGTEVGPIRGRLVVRGQRWRFLVLDQKALDESDVSKLLDGGLARQVLPRHDTVLRRDPANSSSRAGNPLRANPLGSSGALNRGASNQQTAPQAIFDSMQVIENLMLDRIAEAISEDSNDDTWTITGRVTEFQNENRLMILTAYRASPTTPQQ
ncbi:hypothetical protein SAMN06265222_10334 [Neorhodopirellula lusitana]|uniref:Uncharacterized protein n=1 Tax=Neorhodopirellula lusitana TaxID=445327 RepID=A0ABY1PXU4_9BACT|nr:hypothetical protein [Neorhodopirellula lusitana]SMP50093.1 hypothetical protein SAMN06265222_10334 [Neorhodopirellula lusitana]